MNDAPSPEIREARSKKLFNINVLQTWLLIIATGGGILTGVAVWANGWMNMPRRVTSLETAVAPITNLQMRVDALDNSQTLIWKRLSDDHDLLTKISQKMDDFTEQQKEMRDDVKTLKNKP